jgi:hypothetical protein
MSIVTCVDAFVGYNGLIEALSCDETNIGDRYQILFRLSHDASGRPLLQTHLSSHLPMPFRPLRIRTSHGGIKPDTNPGKRPNTSCARDFGTQTTPSASPIMISPDRIHIS